MSDTYLVIHTSTTTDESTSYVPRDATELISLSWVTVDARTLECSSPHQVLVRPANTPITPYCRQATGITWEQVRGAGTFSEAMEALDAYVKKELKEKDFSLATFDVSRITVQMAREARDKNVELPKYLQAPRVFDLYTEYARWSGREGTIETICEALGIEQKEKDKEEKEEKEEREDNGEEGESEENHSAALYADILVALARKSLPVHEHTQVLTRPHDAGADARAFSAERSKVLYLANLAVDTTQADLEAFLVPRPTALWMLSGGERKGNAGFAVFATHEDAADALVANGRALNDRVVEVQPSSARVLDRAAELVAAFPSLRNRPRPGDWTCPSCGFSNFQRRTHCFRCSFPASSAVAIQESMYSGRKGYYDNYHRFNSVPFRAGDWKCDLCMYHNFAKNLACLKCTAAKPAPAVSVNSTAAAIAAATASGQPLNLGGFPYRRGANANANGNGYNGNGYNGNGYNGNGYSGNGYKWYRDDMKGLQGRMEGMNL